MRRVATIALALAIVLSPAASGCAQTQDTGSFSSLRSVAELATLECTYHNVAEVRDDGFGLPGILSRLGYKKAWFEYSGTVTYGIDASRVTVSEPDADGVVTIEMPEPHVVGTPEVDDETITNIYSDASFLNPVTNEDKAAALAEAQKKMVEGAEQDQDLRRQARDHAADLLAEYVESVGATTGERLTARVTTVPDEG